MFSVDIPNDNLILSRDIYEREGMWSLSCMDIFVDRWSRESLGFYAFGRPFQKCDYVEIKLVAHAFKG